MFMKNRKCWMTVAAIVACLVVVTAAHAVVITPTGTNPTTGVAWAVGDKYQLIFTTSTDCKPSDVGENIASYDALVTARAEAAGSLVAGSGASWYCVGSTATVNAKDHAVVSAPVYRVEATGTALSLVATNFADMWDGSIAVALQRDEFGAAISPGGWAAVESGSNADGTMFGGWTLGLAVNVYGQTDATGPGWLAAGSFAGGSGRLYALSNPLTIVPEPSTLTLLGAALLGLICYAWRKRK